MIDELDVTRIQKYIDKCFEDAFASENRTFEIRDYCFRFVIVDSNIDGYHLLPLISTCKYERIRRKVQTRLSNNLHKNFNIHFGRTDDFRFLTYKDGYVEGRFSSATFDYNYCQGYFAVDKNGKNINVSLSLFDEDYFDMKRGNTMIAYRYEKLLFHYWQIDADIYKSLPKDDKRSYLPDKFSTNWDDFSQLYLDTFGEPIGYNYKFICGPGVERYC